MRRRHALHALAGLVVPTAGCSLVDAPQQPASGRTRSPTRTSGPYEMGDTVDVEAVGTVAIESVAVQRSLIHAHLWRDLYEPANAQMLLFRASLDTDGDPELSYDVRLDGTPVGSRVRVRLSDDGTRYALSVPVRSVDDAALVLASGPRPAWRLPRPVIERLAAAPAFSLRDATIRDGEDGTVLQLTVENHGDRDGTFRGIVVSKTAADADAAVRFPVPAGETVTETVRDSIVREWDPTDEFVDDIDADTRRFVVGYA